MILGHILTTCVTNIDQILKNIDKIIRFLKWVWKIFIFLRKRSILKLVTSNWNKTFNCFCQIYETLFVMLTTMNLIILSTYIFLKKQNTLNHVHWSKKTVSIFTKYKNLPRIKTFLVFLPGRYIILLIFSIQLLESKQMAWFALTYY